MARASDVDPDEVVGYKALIRDPFTGIEFWVFLTPAEYQRALRYLIDYEAGRIGARRRWEEFARRVYDAYVPPEVRRYIPIGYFTYYLFYNVVKFERFEAIVERKVRRYQAVLTYYIPQEMVRKSLYNYAGEKEDREAVEEEARRTNFVPLAEFRAWTTTDRILTPTEEHMVLEYLKREVAFMFTLFSSLAVSILTVGGVIRMGVEKGVIVEKSYKPRGGIGERSQPLSGALITTRVLREYTRGRRYVLPCLRGARVKRMYYTEDDFIRADERLLIADHWNGITNTHPLEFMTKVKKKIKAYIEEVMRKLREGDTYGAGELLIDVMKWNHDAQVVISGLDYYRAFIKQAEDLL